MVITDFSIRPYPRIHAVVDGPTVGWHLRLTDDFGRVGWGEAAPWPGFGPTIADVPAALSALCRQVRREAQPISPRLAAQPAVVRHAFSLAWTDLEAQCRGLSLGGLYGASSAGAVGSHALVSGPHEALKAVEAGAQVLKLKVGRQPLADDLAYVAQIRDLVPNARLRLDVNGRWTRPQAEAAFDALTGYRLDWVEQPLPSSDFEGHARLARRFAVPVALDESVIIDPSAALDVAAVMVLKPMFLGALTTTLELAKAAFSRARGVCLTHALGSVVERTGVHHLAAALNDGAVHGVGRPGPDGKLRLPQALGLGVSP